MKKILLLFSFAASISCQKSENSTVNPDNLTLLTGGNSKKWNLVLYKISDVSALRECDKDDIFTFSKADMKYSHDRGTVKCTSSEVGTSTVFSLSSDKLWINLNNTDYFIDKLDSENFQITGTAANKVYILGYKAIK